MHGTSIRHAVDHNAPDLNLLLLCHDQCTEVATTPYVNRMVQLLPEWRGVNVFEEASQRRLNRLVMWMEASLERPSAKMTDVPAEDLVNGMIDREWNKM